MHGVAGVMGVSAPLALWPRYRGGAVGGANRCAALAIDRY